MIKVSVWYRRGVFLAVAAACCGGGVGTLPEANQRVGVGYWRPVWMVLALCLPPARREPLWGAGETNIMSQSTAHSDQIGYAVSEAQEKPSVFFI